MVPLDYGPNRYCDPKVLMYSVPRKAVSIRLPRKRPLPPARIRIDSGPKGSNRLWSQKIMVPLDYGPNRLRSQGSNVFDASQGGLYTAASQTAATARADQNRFWSQSPTSLWSHWIMVHIDYGPKVPKYSQRIQSIMLPSIQRVSSKALLQSRPAPQNPWRSMATLKDWAPGWRTRTRMASECRPIASDQRSEGE